MAYLSIDDMEKGFAEARFRRLFAEAIGLEVKWIEWRDLGYGHQPVARIDDMPVLVGLTWPNEEMQATIIAKKRSGEARTQVALPSARVDLTRHHYSTSFSFKDPYRNALAVKSAATEVCDRCETCQGAGRYEYHDDFGRPIGEWGTCRSCFGRGWRADKTITLLEDVRDDST